jgi:hypothetical protein
MISSVRALPERVHELGDLYKVALECDACDRTIQIYPSPSQHYAPGLRLPAMLYGHSCTECGRPYSHLVLSLDGRGIPFHQYNRTGQWVLDRAGAWTERCGGFWEDFDYGRAARRNEAWQAERERMTMRRVMDLEPDEVVVFTCGAYLRGRRCRHSFMLRPARLAEHVRPDDLLSDLAGRARCSKCKQRSALTTMEVQKMRR